MSVRLNDDWTEIDVQTGIQLKKKGKKKGKKGPHTVYVPTGVVGHVLVIAALNLKPLFQSVQSSSRL